MPGRPIDNERKACDAVAVRVEEQSGELEYSCVNFNPRS